jgi:phosphoglycolate phosphatase-like HAD superfamily hydrolase
MAQIVDTTLPTILALDFDGVLCDGLAEYFATSWRVYCQIWSPPDKTPPEGLAEQFYRMRPVVETGWEMPLVLRSLLLGAAETEILQHWATIAQQQIEADRLSASDLSAAVDRVRDEWIAADLESWLALHRFYPGATERLQQVLAASSYPVIITTKEGRFVQQLLRQQAIEFPAAQIWGKEIKRPKAQSLRQLLQSADSQPLSIWFVEDRLKTLQAVQSQPDLAAVKLFLADWGYNTAAERKAVQSPIHLLSLTQFAQDFSCWLSAG